MTKHVKAIKSHLEYCIRVSNDELWGDLFQWSTSLVSLNEHIAWEERPFRRQEAQSSGTST